MNLSPKSMLVAAMLALALVPLSPRPIGADGQRPANKVLEVYRATAGGTARLHGIRTVVARGRNETKSVMPHGSPLLLRFVLPDRWQMLSLTHPSNANGPLAAVTVDGKQMWRRGAVGITEGAVDPTGRLTRETGFAVHIRRHLLSVLIGIVPSTLVDRGIITLTPTAPPASATNVDAFEVADDIGPFGTLCFQSDKGLPVSFTMRYLMLMGKPTEGTRVAEYHDYRPFEGVLLPTRFVLQNGRQTYTVEDYVLNGSIAPDAFSEPHTPAAVEKIVQSLTAKAPR